MKKQVIIIGVIIISFIVVSIIGFIWIRHLSQDDSCLDKGRRGISEKKLSEGYNNLDSMNLTDIYWHAESDSKLNREYLVKGVLLDSISQSPSELIDILNRRKSECKIEYLDIVGDTIIIRILNDKYLSEQMGSTGAFCFLGETTYTLTENKSLKYVRIEMDYGSHAGPGVYSRDDYRDLIIN
jgi:hypothetical protein